MKKIFLVAISLLLTLPAFADTFQYTYEGQTLNYECISQWECAVCENPGISGAVTIPDKVTYNGKEYTITKIGEMAFERCDSLKSISLSKNLSSIGYAAFYGCSGIESITIPNSVTSIESHAFAGCSSLKSVSLPANLSTINGYIFFFCTSLEAITIPDGVTSIEWFAFKKCSNLKYVNIPNSVTTIGYRAFEDCTSLTSITLGTELKNIVVSTFNDCTNLKSITCLAVVPPTIKNDCDAFDSHNCTLYVNQQNLEAYQNAYWWKDFGAILPIKKNMGTATTDDVLKVSGSNGSIVIGNAPIGSTVVVKDTNNVTVSNEVVKDANQTISLNRKGIFIVTVDDATYKVAL